MEAAPPNLSCRGVVKTYELASRRVEALRGVDLEIAGAGFFAVMGASGSGKSTLMHLVGGLDRPTAGEITVAGARVDRMSESELTRYRRRTIGIVFQHFNLLPSMSALDNVMLPALLDGLSRKDAEPRARELLGELGVGERASHRPDALSGGEQQRVAIARAFVNKPAILIADEPTGNLDPATSEGIMKLLERINRTGTTVVMATHDAAIVDQMRKRVIELEQGHLVRDQSRGVYGYSR